MKILQKNRLFACTAIVFAFTLCLFSCEHQEILPDEVAPPLTEDILMQSTENDIDERSIPDCWCKYRSASRRTSSSSYVYCYGYNGISKEYTLADMQGKVLQTKYSSNYFVYFSGLQSGKKYKYRTYTHCNRPRYSPWTTFTQKY